MPSTTIQVSTKLRARLAKHKTHPRQPYEEVIAAALDALEERGALRAEAGAGVGARRV